MAKNLELEEFVEFLKSEGHEDDYLKILKIIYDCSKNLKLIDDASRDQKGFDEVIKHIYTFYKWYSQKHSDKKFVYDGGGKVDVFFKTLKKAMDKVSYNARPDVKFETIQTMGNARDFFNQVIPNTVILEIKGDGDYRGILFDSLAKPLFKNIKEYSDIALFLNLKD